MKSLLSLVVLLISTVSHHVVSSFSSTSHGNKSNKNMIVVISPPGDTVGQVAAVETACLGHDVKWFIVSSSSSSDESQMSLTPFALAQIQEAGGSIELAGATATNLLLWSDAAAAAADDDDASSALVKWCQNANGLICCMDGIPSFIKGKMDEEDPRKIWMDGIKVAAQKASATISGSKVAILAAQKDDENEETTNDIGVGGLLKSVIGANNKGPTVPSSLASAMSTSSDGGGTLVKLRHGQLFGIPESSPNFSALVGGPRKDATLCEEYTLRSVRMDPTLSVLSKSSLGGNLEIRSSRHAIGQAAALLATQTLPITITTNDEELDVVVSSLVGSDSVPLETWQAELSRVEEMLQSGQAGGAQEVFSASFSSVPDIERLANWLATKWAPAVLRTYDIAAIRRGARPVYASRTDDGEGLVEIVWQQLDDEFQDVITAGKLIIQVNNDGLVATRAAGDASKGFGSVSRQALPGETVLVRRLADAASQAIEKGLANKVSETNTQNPTVYVYICLCIYMYMCA